MQAGILQNQKIRLLRAEIENWRMLLYHKCTDCDYKTGPTSIVELREPGSVLQILYTFRCANACFGQNTIRTPSKTHSGAWN